MASTPTLLAADIGGTNSRFGAFALSAEGELVLTDTVWLKTREADGLKTLFALLAASEFPLSPGSAEATCLAFAGPVVAGQTATPPNIPWSVDISGHAERFGARTMALINDFVAQGLAVRSPLAANARRMLPGRAAPGTTIAVMGAGTGLGKCALVPDGLGGYAPMASEGGHVYCPFQTDREHAFLRFLQERKGPGEIIDEHVVSGSGLSLLHEFLTGASLSPEEVAQTFAGLSSPGTPEACANSETLHYFARFFGRAARDFALTTLALGGLYIAGGVAAKNPCVLAHREFERAFRQSRTHGHILGRIPVYLMDNEDAGLYGAAVRALDLARAAWGVTP